jgi:chromatin assembly factor 1 subunit B
MTSSDGFCSTLTFTPGELGQIYTGEVPTVNHPTVSGTAVSSSQNTSMQTPTSTIGPPSPFTSGHHQRTPSNPTFQPSSPTRSNSTSSAATQATYANPAAGTILSNPPLVAGSIPGITAGSVGNVGLGLVSGVPITTPPQTPRSTTSSVSGVKRDASESEKEDVGHEKKKRRIAPTLVSGDPKPNPASS